MWEWDESEELTNATFLDRARSAARFSGKEATPNREKGHLGRKGS